ncbi:MAG: arylesterase [Candidatus Binatia bacterium]
MNTTQLTRTAGVVGILGLSLLFLLGLSAARPAARVLLFLGDSITAGYGLDPEQAFPALIQEKIDSRGWNFRVINAGQNGDTSAGGLNRLDWLLKNRVDVLVLELGGNDGLRGLPTATTAKNLQGIIDRTKAKYPDAKVIIAGMKVPPNMGGDYGRRFEAVFTDLAKKNQAVLIPFVLEGVGGVRALNLPDGIHPTARGHEIIAATVWKFLEPVLKKSLPRT